MATSGISNNRVGILINKKSGRRSGRIILNTAAPKLTSPYKTIMRKIKIPRWGIHFLQNTNQKPLNKNAVAARYTPEL